MHFLSRGYPLELLEEAALLARRKVRAELLENDGSGNSKKEGDEKRIFLIKTFHPSDHILREIVYKNSELLGGSPHTEFTYERKLVVGYRRPKRIRDLLVRAIIPFKEGDELADPTYEPETAVQEVQTEGPKEVTLTPTRNRGVPV
jgi:hypothetical protein